MREKYVYELVAPDGAPIMELDGVLACRLSGNVNRQIRWDGAVSIDPAKFNGLQALKKFVPAGVDPSLAWAKIRLKISYERDDEGQAPLGVFLIEPDTTTRYDSPKHGRGTLTLNLYERTKIPAGDVVTAPHVEARGGKISDRVRALLESAGETSVSLTDRPEALRTDMVWDAGVSKLRIINDLLAAGGFFALHTNPIGQYQITPYLPPTRRPIAGQYLLDTAQLYAPTVVTAYPETGVNRVVLVAKGDEGVKDLKAIAEDRANFEATGSWRTVFDDGVEATSQQVLEGMARRRLSEATRATWVRTRQIEDHAIGLNDVVSDGESLEVVEELSLDCRPGALITMCSRQVKGGV